MVHQSHQGPPPPQATIHCSGFLARISLQHTMQPHSQAVAYLATDLVQGRARPDGEEELEFKWLPFADVMAMIARGEITDALTVLPMQALALERAAGA